MRIIRRLLQVTLLVLTLVVGVTSAAVIVSQTAWFRDWLRGFVVRQGNQYLNGRLTIGRLGGNIFFGIELEDIALSMNGEPVVTLKDAGIRYSVLQLLTRNLVITSLRLNEPVIHMRREDGGGWQLSDLVKKQARETKRTGPGLPVQIHDITVTGGSFMFDDRPVGTSGVDVPRALNRLDAKIAFAYAPVHYTIDITNVSFRGQSPAFDLNALSGKVSVSGGTVYLQKVAIRTGASSMKIEGAIYNYVTTPTLDIKASADKFDLNEVARIVPSLGRIDLQPAFKVSAKGPLDNLNLDVDLQSPRAGDISGPIVADLTGPDRRFRGILHLRDVNVGAIVRRPEDGTDLTGLAKFDLTVLGGRTNTALPLRGTYSVQAEKVVALGYAARNVNARGRLDGSRLALDASADAYGGRGTAAGTIVLPQGTAPIQYDLHGAVAGTDLRQLPRTLKMPRVATNLNLDYHVQGSGSAISGSALLRSSTLAGATIGNGTTATFSYGGGQLSYSSEGSIARLDLQGIGEQFKISSLAADRFRSDINGNFKVSGSGTTMQALRLDASGTLANSTLLGTTLPQMTFQSALANQRLDARADGQFRDLNPAIVTGSDGMKGNLSGTVNMTLGLANLGAAPGTSTLVDDLSVNGKVSLQPSSIAGMQIDKATFDGQYANRAGDIRQMSVTGPDLQLRASGPLALNDTGQSLLKYKLTTATLDRIGKLVDKPLQGGATLDGQLTGNATTLRLTGVFKGSNFAYAGLQALELTSDYQVDVPHLVAADATVHATTSATFVQAAGQEINQVTVKTVYAKQSLDFDADLRQPKRTLTTAGSVLLHTDHQEAHLWNLGLQAGKVTWKLAPGSQPVVQYVGGDVTVRDFRLVNGGEEIQAQGTIGARTSNLEARLSNFDLGNVDAIMLTDRGLGGRLNAQATITGPRDALTVAGQFGVNGGSFRQFTYQSLDGRVNYAKNRLSLDVKLQENPSAFVTATGSIPTAVFAAAATGPDAAAPVDVRIESSPLDLGLIEGFTADVQKVTGTAKLDIQVAGTAADPHMNGAIDVTNGSFLVVPNGVTYSAFNSHITLQPDRVTVENLSIADNHGAALTMKGDLALHEGEVGGVNIAVRSHDFKVVDNELGNVRVNTDVKVGGEIRRPRITGTVAINTGTINIDKVLDIATSSAYSTTAETVAASEGGQPASQPIGQPVNQPASAAANAPKQPGTPAEQPAAQAQPAATPGAFDAAAIDVHFTVPDDLVIKGNDIRVGQSSVGMGNVNLTIGGDVRIQKSPGDSMRLLGQVQTIRGTYDFQGRRFDIQRGGTVRFGGFQPPNPSLDITATRLITGVEARVRVSGTVRRPSLSLSSNPPLEEADVLSLIIFGQPSNQLGEGQQVSLAQRAGTIAGGFVAGKLAQSIGQALNLDTFEIQTSNETGQAGATVTVGEQLGQRLYVKLRQGVGADSSSEFVLDYQLTNFLRFESTMSQGGSTRQNIMQRVQQSGADLIFLFSF